MSNFLQLFSEQDPDGFRAMQAACQLSRSNNISPLEKMALLLEIHDACHPYMLQAAAENLAETEAKPKYVWRNGAKVKVS